MKIPTFEEHSDFNNKYIFNENTTMLEFLVKDIFVPLLGTVF